MANKSRTSILMMISSDEFMTVWHKIVSIRVIFIIIVSGSHLLYSHVRTAPRKSGVTVCMYSPVFVFNFEFVNSFLGERASR